MRLADKTAIVTGAASGIGRAIARGFAAEGARVAVADLDQTGAERTAADIRAADGVAIAVQVDVRDSPQVADMVARTVERFDGLDILVAAAGISTTRHFLDLPPDEWERVIGVNLTGLFLCGQHAARRMAAAGGGVIINITSQLAEVTQPKAAHYVASKGGGKMLTKAMAVDLAPHNIRVNALAPGLTNTALTNLDDPDALAARQHVIDRIPLRRPAQPDEMVGAAVFLASDESRYVTGAMLVVDGGYLAV